MLPKTTVFGSGYVSARRAGADTGTQGDRILSCSGEHRQQVVFVQTT
jgi:hypothetical protein